MGGHNVVLINRPSTVVVSALLIIGDNCQLVVMCRLGLEALSRPKPALESQAKPEPCRGLQAAHGSGFDFVKPEPWA